MLWCCWSDATVCVSLIVSLREVQQHVYANKSLPLLVWERKQSFPSSLSHHKIMQLTGSVRVHTVFLGFPLTFGVFVFAKFPQSPYKKHINKWNSSSEVQFVYDFLSSTFEHLSKTHLHSFCLVADFECLKQYINILYLTNHLTPHCNPRQRNIVFLESYSKHISSSHVLTDVGLSLVCFELFLTICYF